MSTTTGDTSYRYCTIPGGTPKSVNVLSEVVCSPRLDAGKEEKEKFAELLRTEIQEE